MGQKWGGFYPRFPLCGQLCLGQSRGLPPSLAAAPGAGVWEASTRVGAEPLPSAPPLGICQASPPHTLMHVGPGKDSVLLPMEGRGFSATLSGSALLSCTIAAPARGAGIAEDNCWDQGSAWQHWEGAPRYPLAQGRSGQQSYEALCCSGPPRGWHVSCVWLKYTWDQACGGARGSLNPLQDAPPAPCTGA